MAPTRIPGKGQSRRSLFIFIFLLAALFSLCHFSRASEKSSVVRKLYDEYYLIRKLQAQKKYENAISRCKKIIEKNPDFNEMYPLFARISGEAHQSDKAVAYFQQLTKREAGNTAYYYGLGLCLRHQGDDAQSAEIYKKAIDLRSPSILIYYELVAPYKGDYSKLIEYFEDRIKINPGNSYLYYGLAIIFEYKQKKYDLALSYYLLAAKTAETAGSKADQGKHLNMIGTYYWNRGAYAKALDFYRRAVEALQEVGDETETARFSYNCGLALCYLGDVSQGMKYYEQSLKCAQDIGYKEQEAKILRSIGHAHYRLSNYAQALNYYLQALAMARDIVDKAGEGQYLTDIASIQLARGDYAEALKYSQRGLSLAQETRNKQNEAVIGRFMAATYWTMGHISKALEYYQGALKVNTETGNRTEEALCLTGIGLIYGEIGDDRKAMQYHEKALKINIETGNRPDQGMCLNNIANIFLAGHDDSQALDYFERALKIARETGNKTAESNRLNNIGNICTRRGEYARALPLYDEALDIARAIGAKPLEATVLRDKGYLYLKMSSYGDASQLFQKALALAQEIGQPTIWLIYFGLAQLYERQGQVEEALVSYKKSIQAIEDVRARFSSEEQRAGYLKDKIRVHESLINLLFALHKKRPSAGYGQESFYFVEKAKARAFLDSLEMAKVDLKAHLPSEIRDEEIKISQLISTLQTELAKPGLSEEKRKDLIQKLEGAEEAYRNVIQTIKLKSSEYAQLVYPEPLRLENIQEILLDRETVLLEYFLGEESAFLFYVAKNDFSVFKISESKGLQESVNNYMKLLSARTGQEFTAFPAGKRIYRELIGPVQDKLAKVKQLIVVPDHILNYLPFEALVKEEDSNPFLAADYRISYAPSASSLVKLLARTRESSTKKDWLAFADPVYIFKGSSLKSTLADEITREFYLEKGFDFFPLSYSREEVRRAARYFKKGRKETYIRKEAKEENLKRISLQNFNIIHFATHGLLDEDVALRSALVLTLDEDPAEDGFFQAWEIYNTKINSDLVVLSACQTGRGKLERGEGVTGLSRAFLYAGAQAVLVSLWNINDRSTSEFIGYFYGHLSQGKSKVEALRLAKNQMMASPYRHPYHWAGFVLIGDSLSPVKLSGK